ncbi:hypothetical protein DSO57_1014697 [Entomophthora muscae]|uniref:Uncharacterized protein n=1 Tax=Entomophthora muscae TaxID=34485 RepID=A0ACC2T5D5_9FUNG|nr:hypothetical protein DSO57_1014697 [Entomophthora muscae]
MQVVSEIQAKVSQEIQIKNAFHRTLIGPGGSRLRAMVATCQGLSADSPDALPSMVKFPKDKSDTVIVTGEPALVEKICAALTREAQRLEDLVTIKVAIAPEHHSSLIGRGGSTLRSILDKYKVEIHFPHRNAEGEAASTVVISGSEADCNAARADLLERLPSDEHVPLTMRQAFFLSATGRCNTRKLKHEFSVTAEFPKVPTLDFVSQGDAAARIDDESSHIACKAACITDESEVQLVLKGAKPALEKAAAFIKKQLVAVKDCSTVLRLYVPASSHRLIVGRQGSTVNQIRAESGCEVELPSTNTKRRPEASQFADGVAIVIIGSADGTEYAKKKILEIVGSSKSRN